MLLDGDRHRELYATREELADERLLLRAGAREPFRDARYMTLAEHRLYALRMEHRLEAQQAAQQARGDGDDDEIETGF